jgi:hypothetical protein
VCCVCVYIYRERERECVCVREREREREYAYRCVLCSVLRIERVIMYAHVCGAPVTLNSCQHA